MKTKKHVFWFLSLILFSFVSCTKDTDEQVKFLKTIDRTLDGGSKVTTSFSYQGSQISTIENSDSLKEFTYTMGLITAITTTNKASAIQTVVGYTYEGGKLKTVLSPNNYVVRYAHNADGTVTFEKFDISVANTETKIHHGILTFDKENLVKEEQTLDNQPSGVVTKYVVNYEYDEKTNPYSAITGYNKLLDQGGEISSNNYLVKTVENTIESNGQVISSATFYSNSFKYDESNYPKEKNSFVTIADKGLTVSEKIVYIY
ncbi:hypothetical protein [Flavobacterium algicola]|uniref:hypothetical protein n=1 Tax=Flavobacterium algicola TaxID=556529 RepID=UPI001EFC4B9A|nr:hypothetical protein [Flavobacterium algicola]MCG9791289.1 hypothetical protein [Flavobacterium algicola]